MSDPNKIWAPGDELSLGARQLNMWTRGSQLALQAFGGGESAAAAAAPHFTPVKIHNATGAVIPRGGIVSLTVPSFLPSAHEDRFTLDLMLDAVEPQAPLDRIAICLAPLPVNGVGLAAIMGAVPARITGDGDWAQAQPGDVEVLQASDAGHEILWQESGTEDRWGVILLGHYHGCGNVWYFSAEGAPAGGTSEWDITVNGVAEVVEFPCPCSRLQTIAALETHSEIAVGDVQVNGGDLPTSSQKVTFKNQPTDISLLLNSLTRSWTAPPGYLWDPC